MKTKLVAAILMGTAILFITATIVAGKGKSGEKGKAKEKAPSLERIEFIHWKKSFAKPPCNNNGICEPQLGENPSCPDCKDADDEEPSVLCYDFMGSYGKKLLKWKKLPVSYVVNPDVPAGLSADFVKAAVADAAAEWDYWTEPELFSNAYGVSSDVQYGVLDGKNAVTFGDYTTAGVIGVTSVWYNPATKAIVEFDFMFDTDWTWGDATDPQTPDIMDLQNIATHELGHAAGLADVYDGPCSDVTMYGYSDNGDTAKRTLGEPDIVGITTLYK